VFSWSQAFEEAELSLDVSAILSRLPLLLATDVPTSEERETGQGELNEVRSSSIRCSGSPAFLGRDRRVLI